MSVGMHLASTWEKNGGTRPGTPVGSGVVAQQPTQSGAIKQGLDVLLVDDNEQNIELLSAFLEDFIEQHGGRIQVRSVPLAGTTVDLELPLAAVSLELE